MHLVDVIKHRESGTKYIIPHGDPLPSDAYTRIRINVSDDEAKVIVGHRLTDLNAKARNTKSI